MIYLITSGSYSDYSVDYYVESEEEAIRTCYALNKKRDKYSDLYEYDELEKFTGEVAQISLYKGFRFLLSEDRNLDVSLWIKTENFENQIGKEYRGYYGIINNANQEKAEKIFYDKLAEFKAEENNL
jgi:hypothetical protein